MATSWPKGNVTSTVFRLFSRAPRTISALPLPLRRFFGIAIDRLPDRNWPVGDASHRKMLPILPCTTTVPPWMPGPGPISTTWSAARIVASSLLHHDDGVADVAQALQRGDHLHIVLRVQSD